MQGAACFYEQLTLFDVCEEQQTGNIQGISYGRTCQGRSAATGDWILEPCSKKSARPKFQCLKITSGQTPEWSNGEKVRLRGEFLTRNIGESPNEEKESFLSQILEDNPPEKYFLSARACQGILRRAEKLGKELPPELKATLERQLCGCVQESREGEKAHL